MLKPTLLIAALLASFSLENFSVQAKRKYTEELIENIPTVNYSVSNAVKSDIAYYLFTNSSQQDGILLNEETVKTANINTTLPTKLFFHGFTRDPATSPWYNSLKKEYFKKSEHNIFYIDWSKAGNLTFLVSAANVKPAGEFTADFLILAKIPAKNLHLIGHSLGSQLAGFVGKYFLEKTGKKISRITGLDPAGPSFEKAPPGSRLSEQDAEFVDVIHTDVGYFGVVRPIGHVDVYPNGGKRQPGCPTGHDVDENCSHAKSKVFFVESVNHVARARRGKFILEKKQTVVGDGGDEVVFGDGISHSARGVYYMQTNSVSPYLKFE